METDPTSVKSEAPKEYLRFVEGMQKDGPDKYIQYRAEREEGARTEAYELIYYRPPMFTERLQMFGRTDFSTTPPLPTPAGTSGQSTAVSRQAHENGGTALGTEDGSDSMVEDGMEADEMDEDDEESDSGSESDSEGLCAEEEDNILAKFADPATTLDERKELGALFLRGGRRESLLLLFHSCC